MATACCPVKIQANHLYISFASLFDDSKDPLDSLHSKINWNVCKYSLQKDWNKISTILCVAKRNKDYMVFVCLFVANENPIVDQGVFCLFHLTILELLCSCTIVTILFVVVEWLVEVKCMPPLITIHLKCQNICIFFCNERMENFRKRKKEISHAVTGINEDNTFEIETEAYIDAFIPSRVVNFWSKNGFRLWLSTFITWKAEHRRWLT